MSGVPAGALSDEERSRRYRATIALLAQLVIALPVAVKPEDAKVEADKPAALSNDQ